MKTAVVIGSTGLIGEKLCEELASTEEYSQVLAVVRNPRIWKNSKIKNVQFDFSDWVDLELQLKSFIGINSCDAFCALGTTMAKAKNKEAFKKIDFHAVVQLAELLNSTSAQKYFVISAMGADKSSDIFYNQIKGEMEHTVAEKFKGQSVFLRPSLLVGDRKEFRLGEKVAILLAPVYSLLLSGPLLKWRPIKAEAVVRAIIRLIGSKQSLKSVYLNDELIQLSQI